MKHLCRVITGDGNRPNKTDAGNGSKAICRVCNVLRSPSPDPRRYVDNMFAPWFPNDLVLPPHPGVHVRTEDSNDTVVTLSFGEQRKAGVPALVRFAFRRTIAFYCIEESIYECSSIPGLPVMADFLPWAEFKARSPVWRSSANFRKHLYGHLESYQRDATLESFIFIGQDFVVLVESIGGIEVHSEPVPT